MKYKDWSDFLIHCSEIEKIMGRPQGATMPTGKERAKYDKIVLKDELSAEETDYILQFQAKEARYKDPELSATATSYLMRRYARDKYEKRTAIAGLQATSAEKGNRLELDAIEILSKIDGVKYEKATEKVKNDYLLGICDVYHATGRKIVDIKASWNINTFLPYHTKTISKAFWFQMQGYMELYDADVAEICFVLLSTPIDLVERERTKIRDKFWTGQITKDKYDDEMETLSHAYSYEKIPIKRRIIRHIVPRFKEVIPVIYSKVIKCRTWLNEFERIHLKNNVIYVPPYTDFNNGKEDNPDPDT